MNFHITHNGCEPTMLETERIKQTLIYKGFINSDVTNADILIILCCTFTAQKEDETNALILEYEKYNIPIIITGCFLQIENFEGKVKYIKLKNLLSFLVEDTTFSNVQQNAIPFVKISEGCTSNCSFCSIKYVKGKHKSVPQDEIIQQIRLLSDNYETIKLVGQDVAAYGIDIDNSLFALLSQILNTFPKIKIQLGSLNPKHLYLSSKKDLSVLAYERITGNIHIPVQSASNEILKQMRREYTIEEYQELYNTLRSIGINNISTDIIAGFPGECEDDHLLNLKLLSENYFSFAEIFMYEVRPKTVAAQMEQILIDVKKRRTNELIVQLLETYSKSRNIDFIELIKSEQIFNTNINFIQ